MSARSGQYSLFGLVGLAGVLCLMATQPGWTREATNLGADEADADGRFVSSVTPSAANVARFRNRNRLATTVKEWLAQVKATTVQITRVKLDRTDSGLEIVLDTQDGKLLQVDATKFRTEGNSLIADLPNAVLILPDGQAFNADRPTSEIANIRITQLDANTIRVSVTGNNALPKQDVTLKTAGLAYSLNPGDETPEEEVVVTGEGQRGYRVPNATSATRTDTPLRDVPASIQVIPRQILEDQQVTRLEEALRNVSGATYSGSGEGAGLTINLRGFSDVPILLDGFRQYGVVGLQNTLETANLERIEVLKGPASILYGEVQPGGVINLVSKQPLSTPFYAAELQLGSRNLFRPRLDFSGPVTSDGKLLYRVNALVSNEEPFRNFDTNFQRAFIAPTLTWKISDRTDVTLQLEFLNSKQPFDTGRLALGDRVLQTPRDRIVGEPGDFTENTILNIGYNFEHQFNDDWKLRNSFRYLSRDVLQDFAFPFGFDEATGIVDRNFGGFDIQVNSYSLQTNVVGKFTTGSVKHTLLFGVDLNRSEDVTFAAFDFFNPLPLDIFNPVYGEVARPNFRDSSLFVDSRLRQDRLGLYLQDQVSLLDNLKLLLGIRYDTVKQTIQNNPTFFSPDASEITQQDDAWIPRVGLVYQPIKQLSLYASYSQSFNPSGNAQFGGNILKPEQGRGFEIGAKAELFGEKLFATLAYFDITKQNVAPTDPNNPFFSIATGEQRSRGVELDITGQLLPGWNIIAAYAYTDAKVTKDNVFPVGNQLNGVPQNSVSLWTTYEIQSGSLKGFGAGIGFNYAGDRQGDLDSSFKLDSYFLTNAAIFYRRNNWRFAINFKNIGDVDYSSPGTPFGRNRIDVGEPFTVVGSVSVQF